MKTDSILAARIRDRTARLMIVGAGYVGLPTAALFADAGFKVLAVDVRQDIVDLINNCRSPINEPGLAELIERNVESGRLKAVLSTNSLDQVDVNIISVQTPMTYGKMPDLSYLDRAVAVAGKNIRKGTLIIIGATVPPGATLNRVKPQIESISGMTAERDFYLAYVPERISPGNALKEFIENPRLVGGVGDRSTQVAAELFRTVCKTVLETDPSTAEVAKLAENSFRNVNIAFANELALICEVLNVDIMNVIRLANTHPRVNVHFPGPGAGGPCLPKDPRLLLSSVREEGFKSNLIEQALLVNDSMPDHVFELTVNGLKRVNKEIKKSAIAVLGTAYKGGIGDSRYSPSEKIVRKFLEAGAKVTVYDPYCPESFDAKRAMSVEEAVKSSDCIVTATDHQEFRRLELAVLKSLMNKNPLIVDARRIIDPNEARELNFKYYGIGATADK